MKQFNAARIATSSKGPTNHQLHLVDSIGRTLELNLSPQAQQQLFQAVLSTPPMSDGKAIAGPNLRMQGARSHTLDTGTYALELFLGPNQTIRVEIPCEGLQALQRELARLGTPST